MTNDHFKLYTRDEPTSSKDTVLKEVNFQARFCWTLFCTAKQGIVHYEALKRSLENSEDYNQVFEELAAIHNLEEIYMKMEPPKDSPPAYEQ